MIERPAIIVVAYSARALASSANRAGFAPLAIDVFGDDDTREMTLASVKLDGGLSDGLPPDKVAVAVETLIRAHDPIGLVYGSGFEHQPETIAAIACETRVFGKDARARVDPWRVLLFPRRCQTRVSRMRLPRLFQADARSRTHRRAQSDDGL